MCPRQHISTDSCFSALNVCVWGVKKTESALGFCASLGGPGWMKNSFTISYLGLTLIIFPYTAEVCFSPSCLWSYCNRNHRSWLNKSKICVVFDPCVPWRQLDGWEFPCVCFLIKVWEKSICRIEMTPGAKFTCKPGLLLWLIGTASVMGTGRRDGPGTSCGCATRALSSCPVLDRDILVLEPAGCPGWQRGASPGLYVGRFGVLGGTGTQRVLPLAKPG